jgi:putative PIN family toxin of toxin-antitoxin system
MRAVIDTNIIVSALFWGGRPRRVVDLAAAGRFHALTSAELLVELEDVLADDFAVPQERIDLILRDVLSYAEVVAPVEDVDAPVRDLADLKVIACAVGGRADAIVTGDADLLSLGRVLDIRILGVAAFLEERGL